MKLVLGVNTGSYYDMKGYSGSELGTVEEVAQAIEDRYGVMQKFVDANSALIGDQVAMAIVGRLEGNDSNVLDGVVKQFRKDLEGKRFDGLKGVPTLASLQGTKWRRNSPNRGKNRPSFIDTGTYRDAFTAVITDA